MDLFQVQYNSVAQVCQLFQAAVKASSPKLVDGLVS